MTSEQKKAIDACKDQAAKEWSKYLPYEDFETAEQYASSSALKEISNLAVQLYGEQCRKEGAIMNLQAFEHIDYIMENVPEYDGSGAREIVLKSISRLKELTAPGR